MSWVNGFVFVGEECRTEQETICFGQLVNSDDGHIGLGRRVHLLEYLVGESLWDLYAFFCYE